MTFARSELPCASSAFIPTSEFYYDLNLRNAPACREVV